MKEGRKQGREGGREEGREECVWMYEEMKEGMIDRTRKRTIVLYSYKRTHERTSLPTSIDRENGQVSD